MNTSIQQKIADYLKPAAEGRTVASVRIGLGYTSVRLDNGNTGLAWTARGDSESCTHEAQAGTLAGRSALEFLEMLPNGQKPLTRTLGLAAANALVAGLPHAPSTGQDVLEMVDIRETDHVVMVGFFAPLIPRLKKTGCKLDILELKTNKPGTISPEEGKASLAACSVAIITATSVVTNTIDGLLAGLGKPRAVIILGPSSLMYPPVFEGTPVTHIAGSWVRDAGAVEKVVSEGGGTMVLKQYLEFATICL